MTNFEQNLMPELSEDQPKQWPFFGVSCSPLVYRWPETASLTNFANSWRGTNPWTTSR
jgi:hypothetical protein